MVYTELSDNKQVLWGQEGSREVFWTKLGHGYWGLSRSGGKLFGLEFGADEGLGMPGARAEDRTFVLVAKK